MRAAADYRGRRRRNTDVAEHRWEVGRSLDTFGADDPRTLDAQLRLADACMATGRSAEALYWYAATHASCLRAFDPDHPTSIEAEKRLGDARRRVTSGGPSTSLNGA
ncbi:tetratricopeptide repeat protein [Nocardia colli]|uniref:Tetratricopeptide repeat protein n=1 Tax=Nocardia colli TaxID=2545717 RepID=A0A5N0DU68_9NOCA|nr:tetratricopeptide repeat protein [Nocardia colli]KAA8880628.1 tetratricopeptide repeat protein [Nocardia colli]